MSKILGLDLGTNSIGWALIDETAKRIDAGVTTFQRGVNVDPKNGNEAPLNVERRRARQMRRQGFYKDYRLTKMTEVLSRFDMFPYLKTLDDTSSHIKTINKVKEIYDLSTQELKNHKLIKYKDSYQLNARIAKLILLMGPVEKKPTNGDTDLERKPDTLEEFINHLIAFISMDPYRLRSTALSENITRIELGRILYQIGKRRGFKSSRKVQNKDDGDGKTVKKKFNKNDKKKDWNLEVGKLKDKYGEELEILHETDELVEVQYPKALTDFYEALDKTQQAIDEGNYQTLGNFLYHKVIGDDSNEKLKSVHEERIRKETKAGRSLYIKEFDILWSKHADRLGLSIQSGVKRRKKKEWVEVSLKEFLGDSRTGILFYQRPLKSQKHLVAKCNFANKTIRLRNEKTNEILKNEEGKVSIREVGKIRCLVSHPLFERFRTLQQVNNLKVMRNGLWEELTPDERDRLVRLFTSGCNESGKVAISKVLEELQIKKEQFKGAAEGDAEYWEQGDVTTNNRKSKRDKKGGSFAGNYTLKKLSELFGSKWFNFDEFPEATKKLIQGKTIKKLGGENIPHNREFKGRNKEERKRLIGEKGDEIWKNLEDSEKLKVCLEAIQDEIWHCFSFYEDNDFLFEKLKSYGLDESKKDEIKSVNLKPGYGSLSLKAIRKILPFMEEGLKYSDAVFLANVDEVFGRVRWLNMTTAEKHKIFNDIKNFVKTKQEAKAECQVKNAVLSAIKKEYEKKPKPVPGLDETRINYWVRAKVTKFLKEVKGLNENNELDDAIGKYANKLKPLLKNPLKPDYIKTVSVVDEIKSYLKQSHQVDEGRLERLWHPAKVEHLPPSPDELPEPKFQTLRNPIVKQALYALRSTIKHLEEKLKEEEAQKQYAKPYAELTDDQRKTINGKPDRAHIELARELNDKNKRIAIRKWNKILEKKREDARNRLTEYAREYPEIDPNDEVNILKYKLWTELQEINGYHICPYSGDAICFGDLFGKNKFQIEHIIPKSRCWSDAEVNLTLCSIKLNEFKKDRTPFELSECENANGYDEKWSYRNILHRIKGWKEKAEKLGSEIERLQEDLKGKPSGNVRDTLMQKKHLLTFERNYYSNKYKRFIIENLSKELNDGDEFLKSLIADTGYITRLASIYLKSYFGEDRVQPVKGATTSMLREEWNLGDKNRANHFHHAEDAIIIAFTNLGIYQQLALHRKKEGNKGTLYHPWGLHIFKDKFIKAIQNIAVYDKQRNKKITKYQKTLHQKKGKNKIEVVSVRGVLHEANAYGQINNGEKYSRRRPFVELSPENWKNNIPATLKVSWEPLEEIKEERHLKNVKVRDIEKPVPLSKLTFSHIQLIEDDGIKELIEKRLIDKGISNSGNDEVIPKEAFYEKLTIKVVAKGKGEIKKCEIKINKNGKVKAENRKLVKVGEGKKQTGKLLRFNEIPLITDEAIMNAVVSNLKSIIKEPGDLEELKNEFNESNLDEFIKAVEQDNFNLDVSLPTIFFEKKIRTSLSSFGIPIKKITFKQRDDNGNRVRKNISELLYGDIPNLTEPAKSIIHRRLRDIRRENGDPSERLPEEFYEEKIYVPVKNVRTHEKVDLHEIRNGAYYRFGNTDQVVIHQDVHTSKFYVEPIPFYFVINPKKYDESIRSFFKIGEADDFKPDNLRKIGVLRKGDYFILNTGDMNATDFRNYVEELIDKKQNFKLQQSLFKVTMISATSFDIQFRKHYAAKSNEEDVNINIKSSDKWNELAPFKVRVTPVGKVEKLNSRALS